MKKYCLKKAARLLSWWIRFVFHSGRWSTIGQEIPECYHKEGRPFIICFWHNRSVMAPCAWIWKKPLFILSSLHLDAELSSSTMRYFGVSCVRGSTSREGGSSLLEMIHLLQKGISVGITPDGPRGPRYKAKAGVETLARLAKVDILPFTYSAKKYKALHSWDALRIALPFTRGVFAWGEPISYASIIHQSPEEARQGIERCLHIFSEKIDEEIKRL
ncbi:MAG: lysophospholipid acyltransferase family protein [Holosporales bacterium]|nr:lysophospholipid acyltransferase family protein [Holosporales bacterium]